MGANDINFYKVIAEQLNHHQWETLDSESEHNFRKNNCILIMDEPVKRNTFEYTGSEVISLKYQEPLFKKCCNYPKVLDVDATWHIEYNGFMLDKGNIPKSISKLATSKDAKAQETLDSFLDEVDYIAENAESLQITNRAILDLNPVQEKIKTIFPCAEDDSIIDKFIRNGNAPTCFKVIAYNEEQCLLVACSITEDEDNVTVLPITAEKPKMVLLKQVEELVHLGWHAFELIEDIKQSFVEEWVLPKITKQDINPKLDYFKGYGFKPAQMQIINIALNNHYNVTKLLNPKYDSTTMGMLLQFMKNNLDTSLITESFSKEALEVLFIIANEGWCLERFANAAYTHDRISTLFEDLKSSLEGISEGLSAEGYSKEQINYICQVSTYGCGISHLRTKEPVHILWMRELLRKNYLPTITNYMLQYSAYVNESTCKISFELLPDTIVEELRSSFKRIPKFKCFNGDWTTVVDKFIDNANTLYYKKNYGYLILAENVMLGFDDSSVFILNTAYTPIWNAMYINNEMVINDYDLDQQLDLEWLYV